MSELTALAHAIALIRDRPLRSAMAEALLSRVEEHSLSEAQVCAALLLSLGDETGHPIGRAMLARLSEPNSAGLNRPTADQAASGSGESGVDLLVLAVKPAELAACLLVFGVPAGREASALGRSGMFGWSIEIYGFRVLVSMLGAAGNVHAAVAMAALQEESNPRCAVLVGMAAGVEGAVQLGDVVVAEAVLEYEFARMTRNGPQYQPRSYTPPENLVRSAEILTFNVPGWFEICRKYVEQGSSLPVAKPPQRRVLARWKPEVHRGVVLAGAKLLEDGSLPKLRRDVHDRVRALEMEGAGFAAHCHDRRIPWLVVRGVADYGNSERSKQWQFPATVAAAALTKEFLRQRLLA